MQAQEERDEWKARAKSLERAIKILRPIHGIPLPCLACKYMFKIEDCLGEKCGEQNEFIMFVFGGIA